MTKRPSPEPEKQLDHFAANFADNHVRIARDTLGRQLQGARRTALQAILEETPRALPTAERLPRFGRVAL